MKTYELMESISAVDEELLLECETAKYTRRPTVYRILLAAAIIALLSVTAFGTSRLFSKVHKGDIVPHTFHTEIPAEQWNVAYEEKNHGYILTAKIDTYEDVPMKLVRPYLPKVSENWKCAGAASAKYNDEIGMVGISWTYVENGQEYKVSYRQESAGVYNKKEDGCVWWITDVPDDVTMTGKVTNIGDAAVYRVDVSGSKYTWSHPSYAHSLIFWSDGYSIFMLQIPQNWQEAQIYEMMCSLALQGDIEWAINNLS